MLMRPFEGDMSSFRWGHITYQDFLDALSLSAAHWSETLSSHGLKHGDVVGLWCVLKQ